MANLLSQVTPLILTFNEEANISRTLAGLSWAQRILVIDSGSTDRTLELLAAVPQVEVIHRPFDSFAEQCNFGLSLIHTPWIWPPRSPLFATWGPASPCAAPCCHPASI